MWITNADSRWLRIQSDDIDYNSKKQLQSGTNNMQRWTPGTQWIHKIIKIIML